MAKIKFEEALKNLENIVSQMEEDSLSLEDSLKKYEEGIKLIRLCTQKLEEAEKRIEILHKKEDGKTEKIPFEEYQAKPAKKKKQAPEKSTKKDNQEEGLLF